MPIDFDNMNYLARQINHNANELERFRKFDAQSAWTKRSGLGSPVFIPADTRHIEEPLRELIRFTLDLKELHNELCSKVSYQEKVIEQITSPDYRKGWSRWETLGDRKFSTISAISNADGRLEVFGVGTDQSLWNCWMEDNNSRWHDWNHLEDDLPLANVTAARNEDGRLEVFALAKDGSIYNRWQKWAGSPIGGWNHLGGQFKSGVSVGYSVDGTMEIFALGSNNDVQHRWQEAPNGGWSDWYSHGGNFLDGVSVERNQGNGLEIFGVGTDHKVYHKWQHESLGGWSDWNCLEGELNKRVKVGRYPNGILEIFGVGTNNFVMHKWQEPSDSSNWSNWYNFEDFKSNGLVVDGNQESLSVYSLNIYGNHIWRRVCTDRNGWSDWNLLSIEKCSYVHEVKTESGKDGLLIIDGKNQVQYSRQID